MSASANAQPPVPFERVSALVRQVTHDVRNGLNAVDLQAALLSEIVGDGEAREEAARLRGMIRGVTKTLEKLSSDFQRVSLTPIVCAAGPFLEDARERLGRQFPERMRDVTWSADVGDARIEIDLEAILGGLSEIFGNAFAFGDADARIGFAADATDETVRFVVEETKSAEPERLALWGREPLAHVRSGGYGLGLFRVRTVVEAHGGDLRHTYDPATRRLRSTLSIPVASHE